MKSLKKYIAALALVLMACSFAGCYVINGGTIDKVKGVYVLETFSQSYPPKEGEEEGEKHDFIKERNLTEYLVIDEDGSGYVVSKEGDAITAVRATFKFTYSEEEPDLITYVEFSGSITKENRFGVNSKRLFGDTGLNVTHPNVFGREHSDTVKFKRVSKKADLNYVVKKLGNFTVTEPEGE